VPGGASGVTARLAEKAPTLLDFGDAGGLKAGATFFVAILLTGIFHQGNWQRIYAARSIQDMQRGFLLGGLVVVPFILLMGLFGLAWVATEPGGEASVALFALVMPNLPAWVALAFIPLGLALVMSSADTAISAITSIIALHDLNHAAMFCDALIVMQQGKIVAHGTPTDVLTEALLRDVFRVEARVTASPFHAGPHIHFLREAVRGVPSSEND